MDFMNNQLDQSNQQYMLLNRRYGPWKAETPARFRRQKNNLCQRINRNSKAKLGYNGAKGRRFYQKRVSNRFAPYAPRNTTSFIIRAKKSGGIASLVSPCAVTPAVLPTPVFSPLREGLRDMAKEEWGVDDYGSMNGLIRLRMRGNDGEDYEEGGSSESDLEEHVEVERRLEHDLSRFEMIYPTCVGDDRGNADQERGDDQDSHVTQIVEENLTLKERLFLMEKELGDLRRRLVRLEAERELEKNGHNVEEESDNEGCGDVCLEKSVGDSV
ncbi:hypothetical protein Scep_003824 [Stephania cephalantha]|uniref:Uncharacterized protein n=1 Tax=Stephania cephalantha TaxID=152367 RepID=A0AAP0KS59_9MAGN